MTRRRQAIQVRQDRPFKGRQFTAEVILWAVRWYLMFPISYRDLELMLLDRGVEVDHTTISRWIQAYAAELEKQIRPHLRMSNGSWRVDETYVKVKGRWKYLYRAVDSRGQTIDFLLSAKRDAEAAKRFFRKALAQPHTVNPRTITVDKNAAYPKATMEMKKDGELWRRSRLRQVKRAWQLYLAQDRHLAASSISVAVAALRFLYTVTLRRAWTIRDEIPTCRQPHQLPEVLSPAEVAAFLDAMKSLKQRVILTVCYAAGLRVSEAVRLKPAAIDSKRMVIRVEAGKGRKDRYVMLSPRLLDILRDYWNRTHPGEWLFPGDR